MRCNRYSHSIFGKAGGNAVYMTKEQGTCAVTAYYFFRVDLLRGGFPISSMSGTAPSPSSALTSAKSAATTFSCITTSPSGTSIFTTASSFLTFVLFDTTADGHRPLSASLQFPHFLPTGRHIVCPKPTSKLLISCHFSLGNHDSNAARVCSGVCVLCQPHAFQCLLLI